MNQGIVIVLPLICFFLMDFVILVNSLRQGGHSNTVKSFTRLAGCIMISQGLTAVTYACDLKMISMNIHLQFWANFISLACMTIAPYIWFEYLLITGTGTQKFLSFKWRLTFAIPVIILIAVGITSPWTQWLFYIDANGIYERGSMYFVQFMGYSYYVAAIIFVYRQILRGESAILEFYKIAIYIMPMFIGTIINNAVYRGGYTQIGCSFSVFMLYLEQYINEVEENKRLKSIEPLNEQLRKANLDLVNQIRIVGGLSNAYFSVYSVDLLSGKCKSIKVIDYFNQMVKNTEQTDEVVEAFLESCVMPDALDEMRKFTDWRTLSERLEDSDTIVEEFHGALSPWEWCRASWIVDARDENDNATNVLFTVEDISESVKERRKRELELEESKAAAETANKAKTDFLFNMSHDIRTPMNAIIGYSDLMEKHFGDAKRCKDYLGKIKKSSNFLLSLINNVLEMARIESGKLILDEKICLIDDFLEEVTSVYAELMEEKRIQFNIEVDVQNKRYYADSVKLSEVFLNILSNAYKYTVEGGEITLAINELLSPQEGYILLQTIVTDNGIGMSKDFLPKIFDEFSREYTSTENKIEGTGLGMPIVKKLVDFMGGTIVVESELGKGTTFIVTIPHRKAQEGSNEGKIAQSIDLAKFAGKRILLVEDNELNAEIATEILKEFGFIIEHAEDGIICVDMLSKAADGYYDLILMDIQMPNLDGYGATRRIRNMPDKTKANIPIIAMTANAFEEDKKNALDCGMNGHLAKPIEVSKIIEAFNQVL